MATVKVVLNRDREKKGGGYSLVIQIIHRRVKRVIYTPYTLTDSEYDVVNERAVYNKCGRFTVKQINEMNRYLDNKKQEFQNLIDLISTRQTLFEAEDIIREYQRDLSNRFLDTFIERLIAKKEETGRMGMAKALRSTLRSLNKFTANRTVQFDDIDHIFVKGYEDYLIGTGVLHNTVNFYLRNLRTIYNLSFESNKNMVDNTPFRKVRIRNEKTDKRALKKEMIDRIAKLDLCYSKELEMARDLFMFSFYTRGMCFVDIVNLKRKDINDGVIYYKRQKTCQYMQVKLVPKSQEIIDKYIGDNLFVFPFINGCDPTTIYKNYQRAYGTLYHNLKKLEKLLNLNTPLTMHVARHSWATIAKESGAQTSVISQGLGHSSERTTAIYLKDFDNSVIDAVNSQVVSFSICL